VTFIMCLLWKRQRISSGSNFMALFTLVIRVHIWLIYAMIYAHIPLHSTGHILLRLVGRGNVWNTRRNCSGFH